MPYSLILILAPKNIFLNENNEVIRKPANLKTERRLSFKTGEASIKDTDKKSTALSNACKKENSTISSVDSGSSKQTTNLVELFIDPATEAVGPTLEGEEQVQSKPKNQHTIKAPAGMSLSDEANEDVEPTKPYQTNLMDLFVDPATEVKVEPAAAENKDTSSQATPTKAPTADPPKLSLMDLFKEQADPEKPLLDKDEKPLAGATAADGAKPTQEAEEKENAEHTVIEVNLKEYVLKELKYLHVNDWLAQQAVITTDESGETMQATCICEQSSVDMVLARLSHCGVGNIVGSVNVVSLEGSMFSKASMDLFKEEQIAVSPIGGIDTKAESTKFLTKEEEEAAAEEKRMFLEAASQIRVEQVVEQIKEAATLTFDYLSLLLIASVIAGVGLAVNSTVSIVASMLVSPIMGPVLALTFGSVINNWKLMKLGLITELFSLFICVCVGFLIGLVSMGVGTNGSWPAPEMKSRGAVYGLLVGLAIAVPSGMGVALSVLGDNTSSLVGVAISASLLPPAVNCGMAFAYAAFGFEVDPGALDDDSADYSDSNSYVQMGGISLALTIVNIGAIFISGSIMFRLKDVTPAKHKIAFWQVEGEALKVYRRHHNENADSIDANTNDVDMLKSVGSNKALRKELLNVYRQNTGVDTDEELANSKSTIRHSRSLGPQGSVKDVFEGLDQNDPLFPSSLLRTPAALLSHAHKRVSSRDMYAGNEIGGGGTPAVSHYSPYKRGIHHVSTADLADTKARMKTFGRSVPI